MTWWCFGMNFLRRVLHKAWPVNLTKHFDQLVPQCQTAMFKYYESRPEVPLYDPAVMRDFCEKNAPGLFDLLLRSITRDDNRVLPDRVFLTATTIIMVVTLFALPVTIRSMCPVYQVMAAVVYAKNLWRHFSKLSCCHQCLPNIISFSNEADECKSKRRTRRGGWIQRRLQSSEYLPR